MPTALPHPARGGGGRRTLRIPQGEVKGGYGVKAGVREYGIKGEAPRGIEPLKKVLTVPRINHSAMIPKINKINK